MMREQIAPVTNRGAPAGYLIFRKQRSCRTVLFVVPDSVYIDVLHGAQVREVAVLAVNDAARRDAAVRVDYHRTIEVEARAWLIGLAKLLLGMVTVHAALDSKRIPFIRCLLAVLELVRHAHRDEAQQVDTNFFRKHLCLAVLMFVLLHDDELPLDDRGL